MTAIEKNRGVATGGAVGKADRLAGQQLQRELGKPVPLLHLISHDSLHSSGFCGAVRPHKLKRGVFPIFRPMITTTSPVGNPRMFGRSVRWYGAASRVALYKAQTPPSRVEGPFHCLPLIPAAAGIHSPFCRLSTLRCPGLAHAWRFPVAIAVSAQRKGSGFPLRRE